MASLRFSCKSCIGKRQYAGGRILNPAACMVDSEKSGIHFFNAVLDPGFRRGDDAEAWFPPSCH
jgi:hypothetical protein